MVRRRVSPGLRLLFLRLPEEREDDVPVAALGVDDQNVDRSDSMPSDQIGQRDEGHLDRHRLSGDCVGQVLRADRGLPSDLSRVVRHVPGLERDRAVDH